MSKQRDRHLLANEVHEEKYQLDQMSRRNYANTAKNKNTRSVWTRPKTAHWNKSNLTNFGSSYWDFSCLWQVLKMVVFIPLMFLLLYCFAKFCGLIFN